MKLFYAPGACSLSPHIVLREVGAEFALDRVDLATKTTQAGADFRAINPKGYVPALQLDDGAVLTEGAAIVQYLADAYPEAKLAPPPGTLDRARVHEHLNFTASELHKSFSPLFSTTASDDAKQAAPAAIADRLDQLERHFADGRAYLLGDDYTVADAYLFVIAGWANHTGIGLDTWPNLKAFVGRIAARDAVKAALTAEGLG